MREVIDVQTKTPLFQIEHLSQNIFVYCEQWSKCNVRGQIAYTYLGVVLGTVRTLLAEWLSFRRCKPDWEPQIPTKPFEFVAHSNWSHRHGDIERLHWICIHELQKQLARTATEKDNLPSNGAIIMLLILGLPVLEFTPCEGDSDVRNSQSRVLQALILVSVWIFVIGEFLRFWHRRTFQL